MKDHDPSKTLRHMPQQGTHTIPQNYILSEDRLQESQLKMLSFWDVPKQEHGGGTEDGALPS